ncbi:MAG: DUF6017 domain-containing protein [Clostridia bacterium]
MAVFRVEKTKNYTVMSNNHLQNKKLSLKAKGLLSIMLSVPDSWNHSISGYSSICKDGLSGVRSAIKELEESGYIVRKRLRNEKGQLTLTEYTIYEVPVIAKPTLENPTLDNPILAEPTLGKLTQLNTELSSTKKLSTNNINQKELGYTDIGFDSLEELKEVVLEKIDEEYFRLYGTSTQKNKISEIAELIIETLCQSNETINIAGQEYPSQLVKERFLSLDSTHIEYVIECISDTKSNIKNIKRYMLATLFNAPTTMDSYYTNKVNRDFGNMKKEGI